MARSGPTLRVDGASIAALGLHVPEPIVSTLERAAGLLGVDSSQLVNAVAAAGLTPWGRAAGGAAAYRWPELCRAAAASGIAVPRTRPTVAEWQARREAKRARQQVRQRTQRRKQRR